MGGPHDMRRREAITHGPFTVYVTQKPVSEFDSAGLEMS
jgi:hypothetical protein